MNMHTDTRRYRRARAASSIVQWLSMWNEFVHVLDELGDKRMATRFGVAGHLLERCLIPLARRLDNQATHNQMVREYWWNER